MKNKKIIFGIIAIIALGAIYYFFFKKKDDKNGKDTKGGALSAEQKKAMLEKIHDAGWYSFDTSNFPPVGTKIPPFADYDTLGMGFKYDGYMWETAGTADEIQLIFKG